MISKDMAATVAEKLNMKKGDAKTVIESAFDEIANALASGEKVTIKGVGSLTVREKPARMGRNPSTGQPLPIKAKKDVKFNLATDLKGRLNPQVEQ